MKRILLFAAALILISLSANSQQRYTWNQYGLSFSVPSNFKVTENTATSFEANNQAIHLAIEVLDSDGISPETFGETLAEIANNIGMSGADMGELGLTTLEGAYIEGQVGEANVCLVVLLDSASNIALLATVTYADGQEQASTNIVNSFAIKP